MARHLCLAGKIAMGTIAVIVWIAFGTASAITAISRGEGGCGWFIAGVVLGPIGLILAFYTGKKCPDCASRISKEAKVCPKCRARLPKTPEKKEKPELSGEDVVIGFKAVFAGLASVPGSVGIILGLIFSYLYLTNNFPDDAGNTFSIVGGLFRVIVKSCGWRHQAAISSSRTPLMNFTFSMTSPSRR